MLIGLISDTHNNDRRTREALDVFVRRGVDVVLHMGDLTSPDMVDLFVDWDTWIVQGNVDYDRKGIEAAAYRTEADVDYDVKHELELGGLEVGMIHGHDAARLEGMINAGFDLVLHGHTHEFRDERIGDTRVVNPGAIHRTSTPSICIYDTEGDELERIEI